MVNIEISGYVETFSIQCRENTLAFTERYFRIDFEGLETLTSLRVIFFNIF